MDIDAGTTAWILTSTALVMLMTPGLALFYGGMVRARSVIAMMMMSFGALAVVGVIWILWGYSMTYGESTLGNLIGDPFDLFGVVDLIGTATGGLPDLVDVGFQGMFAVITVALISGSIADRAKFWPWLLFTAVWATLAYFPVAHWVWGGGWIQEWGVIDFAGGTAVHINAGAAGLALALVLGPRLGFAKGTYKPHNLPLVLIGAGLLWFGWFGFNGGSAYAADAVAGLAIVNTIGAAAAAIIGWLIVEQVRDGHATSLGAASGTIAGLVAITPAAGALTPLASLALGLVAGAVCSAAVTLKFRLKYDDSLDVVAVHLLGGVIGTVAIGFLAAENGLLYGGGAALLGKQVVSVAAVIVYSFAITYVIGWVMQKTIGFRASADTEAAGVDILHGETGYDFVHDAPDEVEKVLS